MSKAPVFTDKEFYEYSTDILFEVGKTGISETNPFLKFYNDVILPSVNDDHLQLRKVFIRGAASPDGPYELNRKLGKGRSMALLTELRRNLRHQYLTTDIEVNSITEDYGLLCILLEEAGDKDYAAVKQIYDECNGDELCCKQKLMKVQDGALWSRFSRTYFPKLRAARFILWFSKPDKEHSPVVVASRDTIYINDTLVVSHRTQIDSVSHVFINMQGDGVYRQIDTVEYHPLFAIKTNLLYDALTLLNGEIEVPLGNRYSVMSEVVWPWWLNKSHNKWCIEMGNVGLEGRFWFSKWQRHSTLSNWRLKRSLAPLHGWFVGVYANCLYYDFQLKKREGSQGEAVCAGVSFGYSSYIGRRWRLEFSLGVGAALYRDRKYYIEDNTAFEPDREKHLWRDGEETKRTWIGPTKAKISLSYIFTQKCKKGGIK